MEWPASQLPIVSIFGVVFGWGRERNGQRRVGRSRALGVQAGSSTLVVVEYIVVTISGNIK